MAGMTVPLEDQDQAGSGDPLETVTAGQIMSTPVLTATVDESLAMAVYLMQQWRTHHLCVLDHSGCVVGVAEHGSLSEALSRLSWYDLHRPVGTVMCREVVMVSPGSRLGEVSRRLVRSSCGAVVVADGTGLLGIITDRDVVALVAARRSPRAGAGSRPSPVDRSPVSPDEGRGGRSGR